MDILYQTLEASADHRHVTADGEEWRMINVPDFRRSYHKKAWVYASSNGRLLSNDMGVFESKNPKDYQHTSVTTVVDGGLGGSQPIGVHRIIAFTFLGPPPVPTHTVDHINRQPGDNHVANLRWADATTQHGNREWTNRCFVDENGQQYDSVVELQRAVGMSQRKVATAIRHTKPGDQVQINRHTVQVVSLECKMMRVKTSKPKEYKFNKVAITADVRALNMFLEGSTMTAIATEGVSAPSKKALSRNTVRNYINTAIRKSKRDVVDRFVRLIGLDHLDIRRQLVKDVDALNARDLKGEEYLEAYKALVLTHLPHLGEENWEVVLAGLRPVVSFYEIQGHSKQPPNLPLPHPRTA